MKNYILLTLLVFVFISTNIKAQVPEKIVKNVEYTTASGLKIKYLDITKEKKPSSGDIVKVHYRGKLTNDTIFDESYKRNQPFSFKLGAGQVIKGWDEGIALLHKGDKAILTIPSELGYGDRDMGNIPPNSTLIFEVELLDITEGVKPFDTKGKDTVSTSSGLRYILVNKGKGAKVEKGSFVTINYSAYFEDGKMFDSSIERDEPVKLPTGSGKILKGLDEGLSLLSVGDKVRLLIPYNLAFGENASSGIPAKSNLIFDVEVISTEQKIIPEAYAVAGKDTVKTTSGLQYIEVIQGTGIAPKAGNTVKVHYTGYFTDGSIFDSSVERGEPFEFVIGAGNVIAGWDEGVSLMKIGGKTRLIVPYQLGYGENGYGPIPAKSTLIFDVELIDTK